MKVEHFLSIDCRDVRRRLEPRRHRGGSRIGAWITCVVAVAIAGAALAGCRGVVAESLPASPTESPPAGGGGADLLIVAIMAGDRNPAGGGSFVLSVIVGNDGTAAAPAAGGTSYYGACVDAVPDEAATGNNCSPAVTVRVPPPGNPDLRIGSTEVGGISGRPVVYVSRRIRMVVDVRPLRPQPLLAANHSAGGSSPARMHESDRLLAPLHRFAAAGRPSPPRKPE